jgi:hypothetical protein
MSAPTDVPPTLENCYMADVAVVISVSPVMATITIQMTVSIEPILGYTLPINF